MRGLLLLPVWLRGLRIRQEPMQLLLATEPPKCDGQGQDWKQREEQALRHSKVSSLVCTRRLRYMQGDPVQRIVQVRYSWIVSLRCRMWRGVEKGIAEQWAFDDLTSLARNSVTKHWPLNELTELRFRMSLSHDLHGICEHSPGLFHLMEKVKHTSGPCNCLHAHCESGTLKVYPQYPYYAAGLESAEVRK